MGSMLMALRCDRGVVDRNKAIAGDVRASWVAVGNDRESYQTIDRQSLETLK